MKKAWPILGVLAVGAVALYLVNDYYSSRLTPERMQEIKEASARLAEAEAPAIPAADGAATAGGSETGTPDPASAVPESGSTEPPKTLPDRIVAIAPESMPETAPAEFTVAFECTNGTFAVECRRDWAPNGVDRFYELVKIGYFTDMRIFRVVENFVAQFGISGDSKLSKKWLAAKIPDDPVTQPNVEGTLTFAAGEMPNTRSAQLFVNLADNSTQLDQRGFAPIGKVVYGMETVKGFYSGYDEQLTHLQGQIVEEGYSFLDTSYPNLDSIKRAIFVEKIENAEAPPPPAPREKKPMETAPATFKVNLDTTEGKIVLECHRDWAPLAADRFYTLVRAGYFDGSPFHKVITKPVPFIAQFGLNPDPAITEVWLDERLDPEPATQSNTVGRVAFSLELGKPETRTSQVFINLADNSRLDKLGFAPFGEVVEGMDVVSKLYDGYQDNVDMAKLISRGDLYWTGPYSQFDSITKAQVVE
ncbi:MAG: peptidylprolyl isomerase [Candidatus Hydrogenedentes bacterium]|nr:peptidylprolyl isomerase [Candidatus Hydrogenedentota bacterium]